MKRITLLFSESSRVAKARRAEAAHHLYPVSNGGGETEHWIRGDDAYLAVNGCRHFLWRLGLPHRRLEESQIDWKQMNEADQLWIPEGEALRSQSLEAIERIAAAGQTEIIVTGVTNLPARLFGAAANGSRRLAGWLTGGEKEHPPLFLAPPGYRFMESRPESPDPDPGTPLLAEGSGTASPPPGPARPAGRLWHRKGNLFWVPAPCFEYWGGLLQGQTDWWPLKETIGLESPWYLDRLFRWFSRALAAAGVSVLESLRISPWGERDHAVILRHDTDDSADPKFWEIERDRRLPATYAVLDDQRAGLWRERLRGTPHLETALHYRSNRTGWLESARMRWLKRLPGPDREAVSPRGLAAQVRAAQKRLGTLRTLHRHYHYLHYPEHLFALEHLFRELPEILGAGSFSRFQIFRYGGAETVLIRHPGAGVPFSFPIRPVIASRERQTPLAGWESGGMIEPDEATLNRAFRFADAFPGGAYLWVFHPAHTRGWILRPEGTLAAFEAALRKLNDRWWLTSAQDLYRRMNLWARLEIRKSAAGWELFNGGEAVFPKLTASRNGRRFPLGDLPGGTARRLEGMDAD
ncbi:MAG: hypothetical protein COV76_01560 [Candidatus Omnitrophica bacterium CG11_big_fil_rev_8_21_14_0_20_64_10]|nr:MAG: hypothetical protein COV76_01560 [Candidatus Omnitrophica bacterium CG11_big_fil_rev_8_21_14_0_20_64_10]